MLCTVCLIDYKSLHTHHITYQPERTVEICELCHKTLSPAGKGRMQESYEKDFLRQLYAELGVLPKSKKKEVQKAIDEVMNIGKERFTQKKIKVLEYIRNCFPDSHIDDYGRSLEDEELEYKKYRCLDCGRPIIHTGRCLKCNRKRKRLTGALSDAAL